MRSSTAIVTSNRWRHQSCMCVEAGTPLTEAYVATQADFVAALEDKGISVAE